MIEPRKFSTIDKSETRSWIVMRLPRIIECMIMCSQTKNHASNSILLCEITGFKFLQLVVVLTSTSITAVKFKQWPIWEGEGDHNSPMVLNGLTWGWPDEHYAGRASRQKSMCHKSMLLVETCEMFWRTSRKMKPSNQTTDVVWLLFWVLTHMLFCRTCSFGTCPFGTALLTHMLFWRILFWHMLFCRVTAGRGTT